MGELGALYALTESGEVDSSVSALPIREGANSFGRNDSSQFSKQVSRKHVSITASPGGTLEITVEGPNPIVLQCGLERKKMTRKTRGFLKNGDIIEFVPEKFRFKYVKGTAAMALGEVRPFATTFFSTSTKSVIVSDVFLKEDELVRKRKAQVEEDEALARLLQEEETSMKSGLVASSTSNSSLKGVILPRRNDTQAKKFKNDSKPAGDASSFKLMCTEMLPHWANLGCVRIQDVIQGDVQLAILSNYMVDASWLLSACPLLRKAQQVVVIHGESGQSLDHLQASKPDNWILFKPPLRLSYGTHHSKAMFLVYPTGLRVIVHTANLIYVDWNNKTQGLWMQDFPLKDGSQQLEKSDFENDLVEYFEALEWPGLVTTLPFLGETRINASFFRKYNYRYASVRLVASVPGYHQGRNMTKWGHMKLRTILQDQLFEDQFKGSSLVYQFSSLGSLDEKWINELTTSMSAGCTFEKRPLGMAKALIVWPTVEDIRGSLEGYAAGNAVPSPEKNVKKEFLKKYWARWDADHTGRSRAIPHIKSYVRYNGQSIAWFLLTSSNLSKAAWGSLQKNGSQIMIRSYELGVCFLPALVLRSAVEHFSCTDNVPHQVNGGPSLKIDEGSYQHHAKLVTSCSNGDNTEDSSRVVVKLPIPYRLPPPPYRPADEPWSWDLKYCQPDIYGEVWPRAVQLYSS